MGCRRAGACVFRDTKTYASRLNLAPARKGAKLAPNGYLPRRASKQDAALRSPAFFLLGSKGFVSFAAGAKRKEQNQMEGDPLLHPRKKKNQTSRRGSIPRIRPPPRFCFSGASAEAKTPPSRHRDSAGSFTKACGADELLVVSRSTRALTAAEPLLGKACRAEKGARHAHQAEQISTPNVVRASNVAPFAPDSNLEKKTVIEINTEYLDLTPHP